MEMLAVIGYRGLPSKEKLDARLSLWSMYQYLNRLCLLNEYLNEILITYNYEILGTGKKFWAFDYFPQSFL